MRKVVVSEEAGESAEEADAAESVDSEGVVQDSLCF